MSPNTSNEKRFFHWVVDAWNEVVTRSLLTNDRVTTSFHASTTQWKNLFSFEVFGDMGYLEVTGKGGSYGEETLIYGKKNLGFAPALEIFKFGANDESWEHEWKNFADAI